jgi:hypothetical protein
MAVTASTERQVEALVASCAAPGESIELFDSVSRRLRRMVPFDGAAWFATDPVTTLATCPVRIENVEAGHCESYWDREFLVEDSLLFRDLARGSRARVRCSLPRTAIPPAAPATGSSSPRRATATSYARCSGSVTASGACSTCSASAAVSPSPNARSTSSRA